MEIILIISGWFLWLIGSLLTMLAIIFIIKGLLLIIASLAKVLKDML